MAPKFPKADGKSMPTAGSLDELMDDPPAIATGGSLEAYRDGSNVRRKIYIGLAVGIVAAVGGGYVVAKNYRYDQDNPTAHYTVAEGSEHDGRPRSMQWDAGFARLALSRTPPGINQIILPDRVVRLADGVETAQFKVNVVDGKTVEFKVLTGDVTVSER